MLSGGGGEASDCVTGGRRAADPTLGAAEQAELGASPRAALRRIRLGGGGLASSLGGASPPPIHGVTSSARPQVGCGASTCRDGDEPCDGAVVAVATSPTTAPLLSPCFPRFLPRRGRSFLSHALTYF